MMTHFLATVEFDERRSLPDLSADLARVFGIRLTKDDAGRFDEVPAYVGNVDEVQVTLFGPTEDQEERECVLEVSYRSSLLASQAQAATTALLQPVFDRTVVDSTGHINCSAQLANLLVAHGFDDCKPIR
ncbi:hypothetical protein HNQ59_003975 [Chitinivorax tropicus]|uniref:Uncharacterized protein n=1 Tax=Chitinivorax tropicus TaxID=714531 RepID=A0A840MQD6_9PROT|nr:hypothetical protein [Chitinivorax tropicus]